MSPLVFVVAASLGAAPAASVVVDGAASDVLWADGALWVTVDRGSGRALVPIDARTLVAGAARVVPPGAMFADACPRGAGSDAGSDAGAGAPGARDGRSDDADTQLVLSDAAGLIDINGVRLLEARALFAVPDPDALVVADLCGKRGAARGELRVPVVDGIAVARPVVTAGTAPAAAAAAGDADAGSAPDSVVSGRASERATVRTLSYRHDGRAYSGRMHRGLRPERGYAAALSLYGPRLFDADVDGDGRDDLVALHERRLTVYLRTADGLSIMPALDTMVLPKLGSDVELRARMADLEGDRKSELLLAVTRGAVPERTDAYVIASAARASPLSTTRSLWQRDGLVAPLGVRGRDLVLATVDTSLMSLSAVVITGRMPVKVAVDRATARLATRAVGDTELMLQAKIDVRAGRMDGAMPVVDVDFDGDGVDDLVALGEPGKATLHKATPSGFALDPSSTWEIGAFVHVVPLPELPGVALLAAPSRGKTTLTVLRGSRARAVKRSGKGTSG